MCYIVTSSSSHHLYRDIVENLAHQDQKVILEHQVNLDILEHPVNLALKGLKDPKAILAIRRIVSIVKTTMLNKEMMANKDNLVIQVQLVRKALVDHLEKMLSVILERMGSLVHPVNLEKMEKKENPELLVLLEVLVFTKPSSMASVLRHYSTRLDYSKKGFTNVAMDTTIIKETQPMLNLVMTLTLM